MGAGRSYSSWISPDKFFENVLEGHQAGRAAVFVHDDRLVSVRLLQLAKQFMDRFGAWHLRHVADDAANIGGRIAGDGEKILDMHHANHMIRVAFDQWEARESIFDRDREFLPMLQVVESVIMFTRGVMIFAGGSVRELEALDTISASLGPMVPLRSAASTMAMISSSECADSWDPTIAGFMPIQRANRPAPCSRIQIRG